jgi:hypothetical protein
VFFIYPEEYLRGRPGRHCHRRTGGRR